MILILLFLVDLSLDILLRSTCFVLISLMFIFCEFNDGLS